jgi:GDPmannose 4,6-dehydratase
MPEYTGDVVGLGTTRILEGLRRSGVKARFYQASSSEMFGSAPPPQGEETPFLPRSPYAAAKVYAYHMARNYREAYKIFAANGILFNHESPRRGETFVTRKITRAVARIRYGLQDCLYLGNLEARRDWGYAPDYVESMWRILQHEESDDFVVATGESHSVQEFCELAFRDAGMEIDWRGQGVDEVGILAGYDEDFKIPESELEPSTSRSRSSSQRAIKLVKKPTKETPHPGNAYSSLVSLPIGSVVVRIDPRYFRPTEVEFLMGDASKAHRILGWSPTVTFSDLVRIMTIADIQGLLNLQRCQDVIHRIINGNIQDSGLGIRE